MPDRMPNRMSEDMSDRMPEDVPVRTCINVMVGITRSKVIFSIVPFVACHCSLPTGLWIDASTICFQPFDDWFYGPILSEERREDIAAPWPLVDATRVPETKALDFRNLYHFEYVSIQDIDLKYPGF